jgi:hypothetical protein
MTRLHEGSLVDCGLAGTAAVVRVCPETEAVTLRIGDGEDIRVPRDGVVGRRCCLVMSRQGLYQVGSRPKRIREPPDGNVN